MRRVKASWVVAAIITLALVACEDSAHPAEWYLGTKLVAKGAGVFGLSVIVLKDHAVAADGTAVFFECERPILNGEYVGLEVRTVSGSASVDVVPPAGEEVWVTYSVFGKSGASGAILLPPPGGA